MAASDWRRTPSGYEHTSGARLMRGAGGDWALHHQGRIKPMPKGLSPHKLGEHAERMIHGSGVQHGPRGGTYHMSQRGEKVYEPISGIRALVSRSSGRR